MTVVDVTSVDVTSGCGRVRVATSGPFGFALRWLNRFPTRGDLHPVRLEITRRRDTPADEHHEVWTRYIGEPTRSSRRLQSRFATAQDGTIHECWGPITFVFDAIIGRDETTLTLRKSHIGVFGVPIGIFDVGRRWLSIQATIVPTITGGSRTTVNVMVAGGRAATLHYVADIEPEVAP